MLGLYPTVGDVLHLSCSGYIARLAAQSTVELKLLPKIDNVAFYLPFTLRGVGEVEFGCSRNALEISRIFRHQRNTPPSINRELGAVPLRDIHLRMECRLVYMLAPNVDEQIECVSGVGMGKSVRAKSLDHKKVEYGSFSHKEGPFCVNLLKREKPGTM